MRSTCTACPSLLLLLVLAGCGGGSRLDAVMEAVSKGESSTPYIDLALVVDGEDCNAVLGGWSRRMPLAAGTERDAGIAALREELDLLWEALPRDRSGVAGNREVSAAFVRVSLDRRLPFAFIRECAEPVLLDAFRGGAKPFPKHGFTTIE